MLNLHFYVPTVEITTSSCTTPNTTPDRLVGTDCQRQGGNHYSFILKDGGGASYSYMTANDINGDGYNYDAIYVPTDEGLQMDSSVSYRPTETFHGLRAWQRS